MHNSHNRFSVNPLFISIISIFLIMANKSNAENPSIIGIERVEFLSAPQQAAMQPVAITKTSDGGFIIAGSVSATKQGWVSKISSQGKILWNYFRDLSEEDRQAFAGQLTFHPQFRGIVSMPNGDTFVCGTIPHNPSSRIPTSVLTHLDPLGKLIGERFISGPKLGPITPRYSFDACLRWREMVIILGHGSIADGSMPPRENTLFWLIAFDGAGNKVWERQIRTVGKNFVPDPDGFNLAAKDSNLFFTATDNDSTEIVSVDMKGIVQAHRQIVGRFLTVQAPATEPGLSIFGSTPTGQNKSKLIISLSPNLEELGRIEGTRPDDFVPRAVYRMRDQSLAIFGSTIHSFGERLRSSIASIDPLLQKQKILTFENDGFVDSGYVSAVATANNSDEFVVVRPFAFVERENMKSGNSDLQSKRGAVVNFIRVAQ